MSVQKYLLRLLIRNLILVCESEDFSALFEYWSLHSQFHSIWVDLSKVVLCSHQFIMVVIFRWPTKFSRDISLVLATDSTWLKSNLAQTGFYNVKTKWVFKFHTPHQFFHKKYIISHLPKRFGSFISIGFRLVNSGDKLPRTQQKMVDFYVRILFFSD